MENLIIGFLAGLVIFSLFWQFVLKNKQNENKGYPEIMSYLSSPMFYCSHAFTNLYMGNIMNEAKAIIAYRDANGPFKSLSDVQKVRGIGAKLGAAIASHCHIAAE